MTPEVLALIAESVRTAPDLKPEQAAFLRQCWPTETKRARRMQPAGTSTPKGS